MDDGFWFIALIVVSIMFWRDHHNLTGELTKQRNCSEEAYVQIENFKETYSWASYGEMGTAIDDLEPIDCFSSN